jgi:hydroxylamine reductase
MENKKITKEMLIGTILTRYPDVYDVLMEAGMHCLGCPSSQMESLRDACIIHELDADEVVEKVNAKIQKASASA